MTNLHSRLALAGNKHRTNSATMNASMSAAFENGRDARHRKPNTDPGRALHLRHEGELFAGMLLLLGSFGAIRGGVCTTHAIEYFYLH